MRSMAFRAAKVAKPFASMSRICAKGKIVVFDSEHRYILNKTTRRRTPLLHERTVYVIEVPMKNVIAEKYDMGFVGRDATA